jgi:hypothetical protein
MRKARSRSGWIVSHRRVSYPRRMTRGARGHVNGQRGEASADCCCCSRFLTKLKECQATARFRERGENGEGPRGCLGDEVARGRGWGWRSSPRAEESSARTEVAGKARVEGGRHERRQHVLNRARPRRCGARRDEERRHRRCALLR